MWGDHVGVDKLGKLPCRNQGHAEIRAVRVVGDHPVLLASDFGEIHAVLNTGLARPQHLRGASRICNRHRTVLRGQRGRRRDEQVALRAIRTHANGKAFIVFLVDQHVIFGTAHMVAPHLVRTPRVIHADVEQVVLACPGRAVKDVLQLVF